MNSLNTFYFPATNIYSARQLPLFLLFQNIHLIQPVEKSPDLNERQVENALVAEKLLHIHTPCPLGEHRDRFLHLVHDIKHRKDDYAAQLSALTLASMSGKRTELHESKTNIVSEIFTPSEIRSSEDGELKKTESLWNNRLILAIAEILDQEEEEIARGMAILEDDEASLFQTMHGDDAPEEESPLTELSQLRKNLNTSDSNSQKIRTRAWLQLFQEFQPEAVDILLTTSQLSSDVFVEKFERKSTQLPLPIPSMVLPGIVAWNSESLAQIVQQFTEAHSDLLTGLATGFREIITNRSLTADLIDVQLTDISLRWGQAMDESYPETKHGRLHITGYVLPGISTFQILGKEIPGLQQHRNTILLVAE